MTGVGEVTDSVPLRERVASEVKRRHYGAMSLTPDEQALADDLVNAWVDQVLDALDLRPAGYLDADGTYWEGAASTHGLTPLWTSHSGSQEDQA